jgi:hypothetical protein
MSRGSRLRFFFGSLFSLIAPQKIVADVLHVNDEITESDHDRSHIGAVNRCLANTVIARAGSYGERVMRRLIANMNPTLRGFIIILAICGVIVALSLYQTLTALYLIARIAFFIAIAVFVFMVWRERRGEISMWSNRAQTVFYGAAILIVADLGAFFWRGVHGMDGVVFFVVLALGLFSMWRVWRDEHRYSL